MIETLNNLDFESIAAKKVIGKIVEKGISSVNSLFNKSAREISATAKKALKQKDYDYFLEVYDLEISESHVLRHVSNNLKKSSIWSEEVDFRTAVNSKELKRVFVELDLYLTRLKDRFDNTEELRKIKSTSILKKNQKNMLIYGGAGAGKTTLLKKICREYLENPNNQEFSIPVVIRFREIDYDNHRDGDYFGLFSILIDTLGIQVDFPVEHIENLKKEYSNLIRQAITTFLDDCNILLIIDGFDEIPDHKVKKRIEREFQELALSLNNSRFILTSRVSDFELRLSNTDTFEICPLNDSQTKSIIKRWLGNKKHANDLYQQVKKSPYYDATLRPLTLSHLCAIYERRKTIPPKPRYIYDFVLNLLLEMWDQQRNIVRPSQYADFYLEKKKEFRIIHLSMTEYWV